MRRPLSGHYAVVVVDVERYGDPARTSLDQLAVQGALTKALRKASRTPTYSYIAPDACLDASATTCPANQPAGLAGEDAFLKQWVPKILGSPAYRDNGMLIVAFALSPPAAGQPAPSGMASGALVLSPYTAHNKTISTAYNAYSLLHSVENLLGYKALGHAASFDLAPRAHGGLDVVVRDETQLHEGEGGRILHVIVLPDGTPEEPSVLVQAGAGRGSVDLITGTGEEAWLTFSDPQDRTLVVPLSPTRSALGVPTVEDALEGGRLLTLANQSGPARFLAAFPGVEGALFREVACVP